MKQSLTLFILTLFILLSACTGEPDAFESFHSFDNTRIAYTDEGSGEFVLLIHGFIVDGTVNFGSSELKRELLDNGYRVIVPDLRGNGRSDKPQNEEAYMNDAEIKDLMGLMEHLGAETYMAVGYSRGSIVLADLVRQDDRITKAVFGGMGLDFAKPEWPRGEAFADVFTGRAEPNELTQDAVDYARSQPNIDFTIMGYLQDHQPETSIEELNTIQTESLVISGEDDFDNGDPAELHEQLPNSRLSIVSGDHMSTFNQLDYAEEIIRFFGE